MAQAIVIDWKWTFIRGSRLLLWVMNRKDICDLDLSKSYCSSLIKENKAAQMERASKQPLFCYGYYATDISSVGVQSMPNRFVLSFPSKCKQGPFFLSQEKRA